MWERDGGIGGDSLTLLTVILTHGLSHLYQAGTKLMGVSLDGLAMH